MSNLNQGIGQRIRKMRKAHHLTQEQLSEKLDISVKHMSSVERGLSCFSLERLVQTADVLDCSMDYLILGENAADLSWQLPPFIIEVYRSGNAREIALINEYLQMFKKLRD